MTEKDKLHIKKLQQRALLSLIVGVILAGMSIQQASLNHL